MAWTRAETCNFVFLFYFVILFYFAILFGSWYLPLNLIIVLYMRINFRAWLLYALFYLF